MDGIISTGMGIASAPGNFLGSAMRHGFDVPTFGQMSNRYNARDEYRDKDEYSNVERTGAALGVTGATALTGLAGYKGAKQALPMVRDLRASGQLLTKVPVLGHRIPMPAPKLIGAAAGAAAVAGIGLTGVVKTAQILNDDGNWGALGMGAGLLAGGAAGSVAVSRFAPLRAPIGAVVGMTTGAVVGKLVGNHVTNGLDGNLGKPIPMDPNTDAGFGDRAASFARGGWNHFSEVGPMTQGSAGALTWGLQDHFREDYSNSERAGAMHGELGAAAIMGTAAVGIGAAAKGVLDKRSEVREAAERGLTIPAPTDSPLHAGAASAMRSTGVNRIRSYAAQHAPAFLTASAAGKPGTAMVFAAGAAATALTAYTGLREAQAWGSGDVNSPGGLAAAGVVAGATGIGALAIAARRTAGKPFVPAAAGGMLAAAALIGVASAVKQPVQQFYRDQKAAHKLEPGTDAATASLAGTVLGAGGAAGGWKVAGKLMPKDGFKVPKLPIHVKPFGGRVIGSVAGAAAGAFVGYGLSSTMPSIGTVGIAAGTGAAIGGIGALALRGAPGSGLTKAAIGAITGATLGMTASVLAKDDAPKADAAKDAI